jgi:serine/threonine-protein kinase HipA
MSSDAWLKRPFASGFLLEESEGVNAQPARSAFRRATPSGCSKSSGDEWATAVSIQPTGTAREPPGQSRAEIITSQCPDEIQGRLRAIVFSIVSSFGRS